MNGELNQASKLLAIAILIGGCGSQDPTAKTSAALGCKISQQAIVQLCMKGAERIKQKQQLDSGTDQVLGADSGLASIGVIETVKTPQGEVAVQAGCDLDRKHDTVRFAALEKGPTTKEQADFARGEGLCSDSN